MRMDGTQASEPVLRLYPLESTLDTDRNCRVQTMRLLTVDQHRDVLTRLVALGRRIGDHELRISPYSNLMASFLLHELISADAILSLHREFGETWYPVTSAYPIARTLFEIDVTAHYISQDPQDRAIQYIEFGHVLKKRRMDACARHRESADASWAEGMALEWRHYWAGIEPAVNGEFERVRRRFETASANGKAKPFNNWSGKTLRQMAVEVKHEESYDVFYSELSSFTHADVRLANRFLKLPRDGPLLTSRAEEGDVGAVYRFAATFLTCFLGLFGDESGIWTKEEVERCWDQRESGSRV